MAHSFNENMLNKLQHTVDSWAGNTTSTPDALAHEIAEASKLLNTIIKLLQQSLEDTAPIQDVTPLEDTIATLQGQLEESIAQHNSDCAAAEQLRLDYGINQDKLKIATDTLEAKIEENEDLTATKAQLEEDIRNHQETTNTAEHHSRQLQEDQEALKVQITRLQTQLQEISTDNDEESSGALLQEQEEKHVRATEWLKKVQQATLALQNEVTTLHNSLDTVETPVPLDTPASSNVSSQSISD